MAHQGMPRLFLDTNQSVKPMVRTFLIDFMLILNWRIGYIMNAGTVCKYIAT